MKRFLAISLVFLGILLSVNASANESMLVIVGRLVNVRSGPGRSNTIIGQVKNGQVVNYLGTEGLWIKIGEMAYIPSVYALPKSRVTFVDGIAQGKPLNELNTLVNPVYQTTTTESSIKNPDGTSTTKTQTTTTLLETPIATSDNTNVGLAKDGNTLPVLSNDVVVNKADRKQPNQVSTTNAATVLDYISKHGSAMDMYKGVATTTSGDTSTSVSTSAGKTLLGVLQSKAVDTSSLKSYTTKHIKSKTVVDTLNNIPATYDTHPKEETEFTAEEFVKRYYKGTKKFDVAFTPEGKPVSGFKLTFSPVVGDIAIEGKHKAIVKQVVSDVVVLIEQNFKWKDKKKTGFYAPKNRRVTVRNGVGVDRRGNRYVFYTPV